MPARPTFPSPPPAWRSYARIALSRRPALVPAGGPAPDVEARLGALSVRRGRLEAYRALCGFPADGALPVTYPHVLATPLHLAMLASRAFPVRPLGLVHLRNAIERRSSIREDATLDVRCWIRGLRETDRGQELDLCTEVGEQGAVVWTETATLLARRRASRGAAARPPPPAGRLFPERAAVTPIPLPADLGRRYAAASGDYNPIHLTAATARLFGFERAIAHGMWSLARAAAIAEAERGAPVVTLDAAFKAPVLLPGTVRLHRSVEGDAMALVLTDAAGATPHMVATASFGPSRRAPAG